MDVIVNADREEIGPLDLTIVVFVFYDTDRTVFDPPQRRRGFRTEFSRHGALQDALSARTDFRHFFQSTAFDNLENGRSHQLNDLKTVRKAIENPSFG